MQAFYDKSPVNLSSRDLWRKSEVKFRAINTETFEDEHLVSVHELMGNHMYILLPQFQNDFEDGEGQSSSRKRERTDHNTDTLSLRGKEKALFPLPQSIEYSAKWHTRLLLHCDSKQRPKPPDVSGHRNATRRILQWNSPAALVKQADNAEKRSEITPHSLSWNLETSVLHLDIFLPLDNTHLNLWPGFWWVDAVCTSPEGLHHTSWQTPPHGFLSS